MKSIEEVLSTEYSTEFDEKRKKAMTLSYHKYGALHLNYPDNVDAIESLKMRLEKYAKTGNTEFMVDVANFAMIEFMTKSNYTPTSEKESPGLAGMSVNEVYRFQEENPD
jgi:1,2-phenylacetyl-CoA epoxidase catalytic subunit